MIQLLILVAIGLQPLEAQPSADIVFDLVAGDLASVPQADQEYTRYLSVWPYDPKNEEKTKELDAAISFQLATLSNRRVWKPPVKTANGQLYRFDYRDYGWSYDAWEKLAKADPYFKVTVGDKKGWINPLTEGAVRSATNSTMAVLRGDWFVARTSLDRQGKGFFKGFYSDVKGFPNTEVEFFKLYGIDEKYINDNLLLKGGSVLQSIVAKHNRELQQFPTLWGRDVRFLWRSLDANSDIGERSVIEHFRGSVRFDGKEFIGSNQNGTHYYYLTNAKGEQVSEVPTDIAQDTKNPFDARVLTPYSCIRCHGGQQGIWDFADVVSKAALAPGVGLGVDKYDEKTRIALEEYYFSDLGQDIKSHQTSYAESIKQITGLPTDENTKCYIDVVEGYLFQRVDFAAAMADCGHDEDGTKAMLRLSNNPQAIVLASGQSISREAWESALVDVLKYGKFKWDINAPIKIMEGKAKPPSFNAQQIETAPEQPKLESKPAAPQPKPQVLEAPGIKIQKNQPRQPVPQFR